mgnify:CR=1 FL=1
MGDAVPFPQRLDGFAFAGSRAFDRADALRADAAALRGLWPDARLLVLDGEGRKLSKSLAAMPVDPNNPLPALQAAWTALGQERAAVAGATSADDFLRRAIAAFDVGRIPRTPRAVAAMHNGISEDPA